LPKARFLGRHIMVKGKFADLLLSGRKKTTIRLGRVVPRYQEVIVHGHGRPLCKARITNVVYKKVGELTEEDARRDGFESLAELYKALKEAYGNVRPDMEVTIIELEVEKKFTELDYQDPYLGLDPVDLARLSLRYLRGRLPENDVRILEEIVRSNGIRGAALKLYGSLSLKARRAVRRVLRRALRTLIEEGLIGPKAGEAGRGKAGS